MRLNQRKSWHLGLGLFECSLGILNLREASCPVWSPSTMQPAERTVPASPQYSPPSQAGFQTKEQRSHLGHCTPADAHGEEKSPRPMALVQAPKSSTAILSSPAEDPDIMEQPWVIPTVLCLNSWPTNLQHTGKKKKTLCYITKFGGVLPINRWPEYMGYNSMSSLRLRLDIIHLSTPHRVPGRHQSCLLNE